MEQLMFKRVISVQLENGQLRIGLAADSAGSSDAQRWTYVEYVLLNREQYAPHALIGSRVKVTYEFGV